MKRQAVGWTILGLFWSAAMAHSQYQGTEGGTAAGAGEGQASGGAKLSSEQLQGSGFGLISRTVATSRQVPLSLKLMY